MDPLSAHDILRLWEEGQSQHPVNRGVMLMTAIYPAKDQNELSRLSIGQRNTELINLRELVFGRRLSALSKCQPCGQSMEFTIETSDIRTPPVAAQRYHEIISGNLSVRFRLPTSHDLLSAVRESNVQLGEQALLKSCLLDLRRKLTPVTIEELQPEEIEIIERRMLECDPQAEILLDLECPSCHRCSKVNFDILTFLWMEISVFARRLLHQIDALARAYSWSENEILSLSPQRRVNYLQLAIS